MWRCYKSRYLLQSGSLKDETWCQISASFPVIVSLMIAGWFLSNPMGIRNSLCPDPTNGIPTCWSQTSCSFHFLKPTFQNLMIEKRSNIIHLLYINQWFFSWSIGSTYLLIQIYYFEWSSRFFTWLWWRFQILLPEIRWYSPDCLKYQVDIMQFFMWDITYSSNMSWCCWNLFLFTSNFSGDLLLSDAEVDVIDWPFRCPWVRAWQRLVTDAVKMKMTMVHTWKNHLHHQTFITF